jgi:hypothetical protein
VGEISEDGRRITGVWSLKELNGTFEMTRESGMVDKVEDEAAASREMESASEV